MALQTFDLNRAGDTPIATLKLVEITPRNTHVFPSPITGTMLADANPNEAKPRYTAGSGDFTGGVAGDDVDQQTANVALARSDGGANEANYTPRNQAAKATATSNTLVKDVTRPRGYFLPNQAY